MQTFLNESITNTALLVTATDINSQVANSWIVDWFFLEPELQHFPPNALHFQNLER